jgi:LuxR family maltose regulon positive regulatory protein
MTASVPLLKTKTHIPPTRQAFVARPRLIQLLDAGLEQRLTLISAPAGFGKTTLLSHWVRQLDRPVAWLTLERDDDDVTRFWTYVIAALQTVHASIGGTALNALQATGEPPLAALVATLVNELAAISAPFVLVLDDYHAVESEPVHQSLASFLDHLPRQLHVVIATREDPPLALPRRRGRPEMAEIRAAGLRFTLEEVGEFLNSVTGLDLAAEDVHALESRTEGWAVGLQMAALSLQGLDPTGRHDFVVDFAGDDRYVADYLVEEVLRRQPPEIQSFLLHTSFLKRLCGPLCDAVLRGCKAWLPDYAGQSQATLEYLESANLFTIPMDNKRQWYRYHHLFADMLHHRLLRSLDSESVASLYITASEWFEQEGYISEAITHALSAADAEHAADLIEEHAKAALERGDTRLLHRWLQGLPAPTIQARPLLCVVQAFSTLLASPNARQSAKKAERWIHSAEKSLAIQPGQPGAPDPASRDLVAHSVPVLRAYQARGRGDPPEAVIDLSRRALAQLPEGALTHRSALSLNMALVSWWSGDVVAADTAAAEARPAALACGNLYVACLAAHLHAAAAHCQGFASKAIATCQESLHGLADFVDAGGSLIPAVGAIHIPLGKALLESNDLEGAEDALRRGLDLITLTPERDVRSAGRFALGRVRQALGDHEGALAVADQVRESIPGGESRAATLQAGLWLAQAQHDPQRLAAVSQWAREQRIELVVDREKLRPCAIFREPLWDAHLTLARLLVAQRRRSARRGKPDLDAVADFLHRRLLLAEKEGWTDQAIASLVFQAMALQAEGKVAQAMAPLERALTLGLRGGYVRTFVDEGQPMAELLREAAARGVAPDYADKLLREFRAPIDAGPAGGLSQGDTPALAEPLTPRELEVLALVVSGASNPEIAEELFITVNTVKRHMTNILGKLGVDNRTKAAVRAGELGLVD